MSELRDFLYLDSLRVRGFVSQLPPSLLVDIGVPELAAELGASKKEGGERDKTLQLSSAALFGVLHRYLSVEGMITDITFSDLRVRDQLRSGQFVEMEGVAEPPVVEDWIARIRAVVDFFDKNFYLIMQTATKERGRSRAQQPLTRKQVDQFKEMVDFLEGLINVSRSDPAKQYIRIARDGQQYGIWCGLMPDSALVSLQATLPTELRVLGRVDKLLDAAKPYKIVDFSSFGQAVDTDKLLEALNALAPLIRQKPIKETDLQARYPDVFVTPLALYR